MSYIVFHLKQFLSDIFLSFVSILGYVLFIILSPILYVISISKQKRYLDPKVIVITGASNGIGKAMAIEYSQQRGKKATLCLTGRDKIRLEEVVEICRSNGSTVEIGLLDVTNKEDMKEWLLRIDDQYTIDLIIANAGVTEILLPQSMTYEEKVYRVNEINISGTLNTIFPLLPRFRERKHGQIVLTSSLSSILNISLPAYVGSKCWITGYGNCIRQELLPHGVGVTVLVPGFVKTRMAETIEMEKPFIMTAEDSAKKFIDDIKENRPLSCDNFTSLAVANILNKLQQQNFRDGWMVLQNKILGGDVDTIKYSSSSLKNK